MIMLEFERIPHFPRVVLSPAPSSVPLSQYSEQLDQQLWAFKTETHPGLSNKERLALVGGAAMKYDDHLLWAITPEKRPNSKRCKDTKRPSPAVHCAREQLHTETTDFKCKSFLKPNKSLWT